jgi:hypothetical protein
MAGKALSLILLLLLTYQSGPTVRLVPIDVSFYDVSFHLEWRGPVEEVRLAFKNISSIQCITFETTPERMSGDEVGNNYAHFQGKNRVEIKARVMLVGAVFSFGDHDVGSLNDLPPDVKEAYTQPEALVESDDANVMAKADELFSKSDGIYDFTLNVLSFVKNHLEYETLLKPMGAKWALENGRGDCSEYSALATALFRAKGIPARISAGFAIDPKKGLADLHTWVEVYLPKVGWVPIDPTWGFSWVHRHLKLIDGFNEVEGPFLAMTDEGKAHIHLSIEEVIHLPFEDQVKVDGEVSLERFHVGERGFFETLKEGSLGYDAYFSRLSVTFKSFLGVSYLSYEITNTFTTEDSNKIRIEGPLVNFLLVLPLYSDGFLENFNVRMGWRMGVDADVSGEGALVLHVLSIPISHVVILIVIVVMVWFRRKRRRVQESPKTPL